jgi:hypothetical protein
LRAASKLGRAVSKLRAASKLGRAVSKLRAASKLGRAVSKLRLFFISTPLFSLITLRIF